MMSKRKVNFQ